ncbi:hypothetical protein [Nocardia sp. IFM 10818]
MLALTWQLGLFRANLGPVERKPDRGALAHDGPVISAASARLIDGPMMAVTGSYSGLVEADRGAIT